MSTASSPYLDEQSALLRVADVVRHTGYSKTKVYAMVQSGELPAVVHGKSVRVTLLGLRRWIEEHKIKASHPSHVS